jgi:hypothetical protein
MSRCIQAAPTHKSEEAGVAESVPPHINVVAPSELGVIAEYDVVSGTAPAVPPQPTRRSVHSTHVGAVGNQLVPAASPLYLRSPQHHPRDLDLCKTARLDREMARELRLDSELRNEQSAMSIAAALARMSIRRLLILTAGVLLLTGGLLTHEPPRCGCQGRHGFLGCSSNLLDLAKFITARHGVGFLLCAC